MEGTYICGYDRGESEDDSPNGSEGLHDIELFGSRVRELEEMGVWLTASSLRL